ncbi:Nitroreductase [Acaromyces ingoldii]|uniref:Nitroreductase n=1 Tax=Acaromyces ingoldii TaxID=215250 RepID=A0A316YGC2_9BASI|nr:Nitroreductase [Acaromyces ingoldii]PWN88269.1 Nitroreductase [Acaromyces ingoldii]
MADAFLDAVERRRTYYSLSDASPISDARIQSLVERATQHAPSAYNVQSARVVLLLGERHKQAWRTVAESYASTVPPSNSGTQQQEQREADEQARQARRQRTEKFGSETYGSVVFLENREDIEAQYVQSPDFKESKAFDVWSENATGMLQFAVWTALEAEGLGASLQHHVSTYPAVGRALTEHLALPSSWQCTAMMPFGTPAGPPGRPGKEKPFKPIRDRVIIFK